MFTRHTLQMWFVGAVTTLLVSGSVVMAQQKAQLQKQNPFFKPANTASATAEARARSQTASSAHTSSDPSVPMFNYTVTSSRDGNSYTGTMVGRSPFTQPFGFTSVPSQIVPVIIVTNSVFAGISSTGTVVTAPGVTTLNPSAADPSCLTAPNDVPITLVQHSPIYQPADFNYGGTDVGFTQTTDAFQRANFFQLLNFGNNEIDFNPVYHVILDPVRNLPAITINVPAALGVAYPSAVFGGCPTGTVALVDFGFYVSSLLSAIPTLASEGVNPGTFPMFVLHNVVGCEGANCATLAAGTGCCVLGFHDSNGQQTFASADFDTSNIFVSPVLDVADMSHEVAEWMNDPFGNNPVPPWGHIGQQPGCQSNLEVGDPLSGTNAPPIFSPSNGFTYHEQELAFFSWFYGAPSVGLHGWYSDNDTFTSDAGPVCQ